ncbi:HD domain-containing phosphohydrolase, partial [Acidobacteriota bacterium]
IMLQGDMNGVDAAGKIYEEMDIPIVYLTAYADETTFQRAKETSPFGYLLKPFEERELQTTIEIAMYKFQMEQKLRAREKWLATILKSIADAVIASDTTGKTTFMNPMAEELTGWKHEEALGCPLSQVFDIRDEETGEKIHPALETSGEKPPTKEMHEGMVRSKTGEEIPVEFRVAPIQEDLSSAAGMVLAFTDITWRKKAESELRISLENQKSAMEGIVQAMGHTIEQRDPYTAGHQRRVTELAVAIGRKIGMKEENIAGLQMASELHDIGKIYVPAEILSKPGKISEVEYSIIKTHPKVGFDILKSIKFPWPIHEFVLQHHERLDGSGYPQGLKGEQIHKEARILAVADVIEAMATHRPYRPALSVEQALTEIGQNKGILYDLDVVEACLDLFETEGFKFD